MSERSFKYGRLTIVHGSLEHCEFLGHEIETVGWKRPAAGPHGEPFEWGTMARCKKCDSEPREFRSGYSWS